MKHIRINLLIDLEINSKVILRYQKEVLEGAI